jgi:hypothetical protein
MRSSQADRACGCQVATVLGSITASFDTSGIGGAADKAVLNNVHKNPLLIMRLHCTVNTGKIFRAILFQLGSFSTLIHFTLVLFTV